MRILMLSHGYPPTVSGVTLVVQRFSRALDGSAEPFRQASLVISREHSEQVTFDVIEELYQQLVGRYKRPV